MGKKNHIKKPTLLKKGKKGKKNDKSDEGENKPKSEREVRQEARQQARERRQKGRTMVAQSQSWTGKLPGALLQEHCQKKRWNKVNYDMRRVKDGFVATAELSWRNPKTQEVVHIKMHPPAFLVKAQETPLEARHYAATYALHRVAFDKNIHMVLPSNHKALWHDLEDARKEMVKKNPEKAKLQYNSDPFAAILEKRKEDNQKQKEREAREAELKKQKGPTIVIGNGPNVFKHGKSETENERNNTRGHNRNGDLKRKLFHDINNESPLSQVRFPRKAWDNAVMMDLDPRTRVLIDRLFRENPQWTEDLEEQEKIHKQPHIEQNDNKGEMKEADYSVLLQRIGFRNVHVEEALQYTNNFTDTLEWLIYHVPEDDLPPVFLKNDKDSHVRLKITVDIQKERKVEILCQGSCSKNEAETALDTNNGDIANAAVALTNRLIEYEQVGEEEDPTETWNEEKESLKAIYPNRIMANDLPCSYEILLEPEGIVQNKGKHLLALRVFRSSNYPCDICGLQIIVKDQSYRLPKYINMSILTQLLKTLVSDNLLGNPYIYSCIDWLDSNISGILENPGPLQRLVLLNEHKKESESKSRASSTLNLQRDTQKRRHSHNTGSRSKDFLQKMRNQYKLRGQSSELHEMINRRKNLPAWKKMKDLADVIKSNRACIITGETGSGKSTQIVQFILDSLCSENDFATNIICTQPRRISAIGLADRVSQERASKCGEDVGYIIRGENRTSKSTRITFVTTGVLLRMIQSLYSSEQNSSKDFFKNLKYIFVDEVHERSIDSDFLLIILKQMIKKFPDLHVVLMSATIDLSTFKSFFDYSNKPPAHVHIEGRTFPIQDFYLDSILSDLDFTITTQRDEIIKPKADSRYFNDGNINYDLIAELVQYIDKKLTEQNNDGSILIFLPGVMEISRCLGKISDLSGGKSKFWGLPLHSGVSSNDQRKVFNTPPRGTRKVVASTNVAETSVTIPDAVAVIDTGRVKTIRYDVKADTTRLVEGWSSRAEISQRRGRAGRIREGLCFHLYTKETTEERMLSQPIPEIKRTPLESVCLVVKAMGISNVYKFLQEGLDPPSKLNVNSALQTLTEIGALHNNHLTALGKYVSLLPTDMKSGKLLLYSTLFGCLESGLTLASISVTGNPFFRSREMRDKVKNVQTKFSDGQGDMIAILNAYEQYSKLKNSSEKRRFLDENCLSWKTMKDIQSTRLQYVSELQDLGFIPMGYTKHKDKYPAFNRHSKNYSILCAIVTASLFPHVARVQPPDPKFLSSGVGTIAVDSDSRRIRYWIRNEEYIKERIEGRNPRDKDLLPATRAFLHPSSTFFSFTGNSEGEISASDIKMDADGNYIYSPSAGTSKSSSKRLSSSFISYTSSQMTTKLYLHDVTPTSIIALLLFGGQISYDLSSVNTGRPSPGIVMDGWLPIRTWCKNAVMMTKLRILLDKFLDTRLATPLYTEGGEEDRSDRSDLYNGILQTLEKILSIEQR